MSKAPCGHSDAECVIGDFWTCKSCGDESKGQALGQKVTFEQYSRSFAMRNDSEAALQELCREEGGRASPYLRAWQQAPTVPSPWLTQSTLSTLAEAAQANAERGLLEMYNGNIVECPGAYTMATCSRTSVSVPCFRNKLFGVASIGYNDTERQVIDALAQVTDDLVCRVKEYANVVAESRGWLNHKLGRLGPLPGLVDVDGNVAVRCASSREYEVRFRAYFTVFPA